MARIYWICDKCECEHLDVVEYFEGIELVCENCGKQKEVDELDIENMEVV